MKYQLDPWIGTKYSPGSGLLILSESTYCWPDPETGHMVCPKHDHHSQVTVNKWGIERFNQRGGHYSAKLTRTICGVPYPSEDQRREAWNSVAYMSFIQRPMESRWHRPSDDDWEQSGNAFLSFLDEHRPSRVLATGLITWENMPDTQVQHDNRLQAYRRKDGGLSWCQAVPHPSSRKAGDTYRWRDICAILERFKHRTDLEAA
jgi:hypothetical protein